MQDDKYDIGLISDGQNIITRCKDIAAEFGYTLRQFSSLDKFIENPADYGMVLAYVPASTSKEAAAEFAQGVRHVSKDTYLVCTVPAAVPRETAAFIKKSGANLIVLENELFETSKLEYVTTQVLKASFLPIKVSDLQPNREILFDVFHLLAQRKKFLRSAFKGDQLSEEKIKKFHQVGELYVHRNEVDGYNKYIVSTQDRSREGLANRCRSMYLAMYGGYANLILNLTDQSEWASYTHGLELLKKIEGAADELIGLIAEFGNAWEIINNSAIGEFGSIERSPSIAAHAALFSLQIGYDAIREVMLASLLGDIGLVLLPPGVTRKIRNDRMDTFTAEELDTYHKYPLKSVDMMLNRKLPLDQKLRDLLLSTNERADGKGFPKGISGPAVPEGAQIILFCRELDRRTALKLGRVRKNPDEVRKELIREQIRKLELFSPGFLLKLKKAFLPDA